MKDSSSISQSGQHTILCRIIVSLLLAAYILCCPSASYAQKTIVTIPKATILNFWRVVCMGAHAAIEDSDINLIWRGSRVENKPNAQKHLLEYYIDQKVDAIVLAPMDRKSLNPAIEKAVKAGIKVIIIDAPVTTDVIDSYIATDNYKAGSLGADLLAAKLAESGPVLVVGHSPDNGSCALREQGFIDRMQNLSPGRTIISIHMRDGSERETRRSTEELLKNTPCIAGIFTTNEATSDGVLHTMNARNGSIPFVAFDYNHKLLKGVREKKIEALITQRPYAMGFFGVRAAIELLEGKKVSKQMESPVTVINTENIDEAETLRCLRKVPTEEKAKCPICFN